MAASINDRYFDLAIVADFIVTSDADERTCLGQYCGQTPDEYQLARFFLMRQVLHMFAATIFLLLAWAGELDQPEQNASLIQRLSSEDLGGRDRSGRQRSQDRHGMVHWEQLLHNVRQPRFEEALRIVSDRQACAKATSRLLPVAP